MPERSTLPSAVRGAGAPRSGLPSAARGIFASRYVGHCAPIDTDSAVTIAIAATAGLKTSVATQISRPRRGDVVRRRRSDHLHAPDLAVLDQERFAHQDAARPVEARVAVLGAVRQ